MRMILLAIFLVLCVLCAHAERRTGLDNVILKSAELGGRGGSRVELAGGSSEEAGDGEVAIEDRGFGSYGGIDDIIDTDGRTSGEIDSVNRIIDERRVDVNADVNVSGSHSGQDVEPRDPDRRVAPEVRRDNPGYLDTILRKFGVSRSRSFVDSDSSTHGYGYYGASEGSRLTSAKTSGMARTTGNRSSAGGTWFGEFAYKANYRVVGEDVEREEPNLLPLVDKSKTVTYSQLEDLKPSARPMRRRAVDISLSEYGRADFALFRITDKLRRRTYLLRQEVGSELGLHGGSRISLKSCLTNPARPRESYAFIETGMGPSMLPEMDRGRQSASSRSFTGWISSRDMYVNSLRDHAVDIILIECDIGSTADNSSEDPKEGVADKVVSERTAEGR